MKRISCVRDVKLLSLTLSSIAQFGDNKQIKAESKALAVQREAEIFYGNEGDFDSYVIFNQQLPEPSFPCNIMMQQSHKQSMIKVGSVEILGVSSSSVLQIGSNEVIDCEARVKHIRQLLPTNED